MHWCQVAFLVVGVLLNSLNHSKLVKCSRNHMYKYLLFLVSSVVLVGCGTKVTLTGKAYPPTTPSEIKIFALQEPDCKLEELGLIVTNVKNNQDAAIEDAKEKASQIGATYMKITEVKRNVFNDAAVTAVALRCRNY